jgi:predicted acetyltransferase
MDRTTFIRKIPPRDLSVFVDIVANAYPGFGIVTPDDKKKMKKRLIKLSRDPTICHYGLYRDGRLMGGMRTYDFTMNLFSHRVLVGGVGFVAVDLLHKKEKICKELIFYFINLYKRKKASIVALHPFRPDFYRKMGFGYGTKVNEYRIKPADLPRRTSKKHIRFLAQRDKKAFRECCERYFLRHHGMFRIKEHEIDYFFGRPEAKTVVYKDGNRILGYLSFIFRKSDEDNLLKNNIVIRELVYENPSVLSALLYFLNVQADQIGEIVFPTQDDSFHYTPIDPRDGSHHVIPIIAHQTNTQGIGIMYRVFDAENVFRILKKHNFGGQNCRLRITIKDSFFPANQGSFVVHFTEGFPRVISVGKYDVEISIDIADFSSLLMGAVEYGSLLDYGLSHISDDHYVDVVERIFRVSQKPICHTMF